MTRRQAEALRFIAAYAETHDGQLPNLTEIARGVGLKARSAAWRLLKGMEDRGHVTHLPGKPRSYRAVPNPMRPELEEAVSDYAKTQGMSREAVIAEAVAAYFGLPKPWPANAAD